ncbi:Asp-tRNA(Asn)/Glu-tRNA(Gln) amidotransferase GatCAB subunit A [Ensifer sp. NM-2]|uniref:amidase n=1 Tax=Ensifer sp. NM-2 TaxID=2109730 RepID=UPI000D1323CA|nr:amidase [Ensifer sp. NM-2]PSS60526.1 Asp-tRNA(Asn)/Glu-tRNA(Gln) amidotransferase GatCAB subunit A [Ensifer sp. NM-2]
MTALHYWSILELSTALQMKKISAVEVAEHMLARIAEIDTKYHSYISVMSDRALARAKAADEEISLGKERGILHGIPLAAKDLFDTQDAPTTAGMQIFKDFVPASDSTVVERLYEAGAYLLGKTNLTEGAHAKQHRAFALPINPWNDSYWVGASSHGSGVATAAGLAFGSLATDTGGSIRFPSACASITGIKPTWGRVSRHGAFPLAHSLDHVGPFTRSVEDAAIMLSVIAGGDDKDATTLTAPVPDYLAATRRGVEGLRVGIDPKYAFDANDVEVVTAVEAASVVLEAAGAKIREVSFPVVREAILAWRDICGAEAASFHKPTYPLMAERYDTGLSELIEHGIRTSGIKLGQAWVTRLEFRGLVAAALKDVDVMLIPTLDTPVPTLAEVESFGIGDDVLVKMTKYTIPFNMTGNPTLVMPGGFSKEGKPISIQLVGKHEAEETLFAAGHAFQRATDWHLRRPIP